MDERCEGCNGVDVEFEEMLHKYKQDKSNLIQILNEVQEYYGYVPEKAQLAISQYLGIPMAEIYGVITFYARFTLKPKGKYHIAVCLGTACYVKGSGDVFEKCKEVLGLPDGGTTPDGKFSLAATRCIGCCGLAPVMVVGGDTYGKLTPKEIPGILAKYKD